MTTADATDREISWLTQHGDGLPALLIVNGGMWDVIGRWPRTPDARKAAIYLWRPTLDDYRFAAQQRIDRYQFEGKLFWPVGASTTSVGILEQEARNMDTAVEALIQRIRGPILDKTHGGAFLSVAEAPNPGHISVRWDDPSRAFDATPALLTGHITYSADDQPTLG